MVEMGTAIIVSSLISMIGLYLTTMMWNSNWFKKQNWKLQAQNIKAENKLKLKKLEREMGLTKGKSASKEIDKNTSGLMDYLPDLIELAKENPDLLELIPKFTGGESGEGGALDGILAFVEENPEILKGITQGIKNTQGQDSQNLLFE